MKGLMSLKNDSMIEGVPVIYIHYSYTYFQKVLGLLKYLINNEWI